MGRNVQKMEKNQNMCGFQQDEPILSRMQKLSRNTEMNEKNA